VRNQDNCRVSLNLRMLTSAKLFRATLLSVVMASLLPVSSMIWGQQVTADVVGRVTDPQGGVIQNAQVSITNLGTHEVRRSVTNDQGDFTFNLLQIGSYSLHVDANGFKAAKIPNIALSVGERHRADVQLEVGAQTEQVIVTTEAPALQTDNASVGQTLETQAVQDLPTEGRNLYSLVQLAPGANSGPANGISSGNRPEDRRQASEVSANGQSDSRNNNLLDGMDNNGRMNNVIVVRPSIDGIQELSVLTNSYPAEVGNVAGAVVNMITKSGTNDFHGTAYEYIRNDLFDSRNYFANGSLPKPELRQNQFGGSIGGPIRRNKTFFFADAEDLRKVRGQTSTVTVPTLYEEQHLGDFSDNNSGPVVPYANLNSAGKALFALYPKPNAPGTPLANNYTASPKGTQFSFTTDARVDHHFSDKDLAFGRFSYNKVTTLTPGLFPEVNGIQPGGNVLGFQGTANEKAMNGMGDYTHIFSPNLILELKGAYTRFVNLYTTLNEGKNSSAQLGIPNINVNSNTTGLTAIYTLSYASLGDSIYEPSNIVYNTFQEAGILSYSRGKHSLKGGMSLIRRQLNQTLAGSMPEGMWAFMYVPVFPLSVILTPNEMENLLVGTATLAERQNNLTESRARTWEPSVFVQDDWRMTPKITVNLGARYDVFTPMTDAKNNMANFDLSTSTMILATSSNPTAGVLTDHRNLAPRAGFSASLSKNTVLHGAIGMSFFPADGQDVFTFENPPYLSDFGPSYLVSLTGSAPWGSMPAPAPMPYTPASSLSGTLTAKDKDFRSSYMEEFNLNMQQQFGQNVVMVGYVGEIGHRLLLSGNTYNVDLPAPSTSANPMTLAPYYSTVPNVSAILRLAPEGFSDYHALQASFIRHFSHGFSVNANYTWSHSIDDIVGASSSLEPYGLLPTQVKTYDKGNSDLDLRNRFAVSASYAFPFTDAFTGWKGKIFKSWQLNGIGFWQSGTFFTVSNASPEINEGPVVSADRPNRSGSGKISNPGINKWFDTTAFVAQTFGTAGNSGKNILSGPHQKRVDLSLFREFPVFQKTKLQFRAESYDVSNTAPFSQPNSVMNTSGYGTISNTLPGADQRVYQFALKLSR